MKIKSVTVVLNFHIYAEYTKEVQVTYEGSLKTRTYRFSIPATVQKFIETHEATVHEYDKMTFTTYK